MLYESTLSTLGTFYFTGFLSHFSCFEKWTRDLKISWNNFFKTLFRLSWSSWLSRVCASATRAREIWSVDCLIQAYRTRALMFRANRLLACKNSQLFPQATVRANPLCHVLHWLLSLRNTMMQSTSYVSRRKWEIPLIIITLFKGQVKSRASHEPNPIQPIRFMWSSAFDPIKFDWFYLERLRRSSRLVSREERLKTDFRSSANFHMNRTKCIIKWKIIKVKSC